MIPSRMEGIRSRGIMGLTPDARAGCCEHSAWWVEGAGVRANGSGPLPHGRLGIASSRLAGLGLGHDGLDPGRAEGDPASVVHAPGRAGTRSLRCPPGASSLPPPGVRPLDLTALA